MDSRGGMWELEGDCKFRNKVEGQTHSLSLKLEVLATTENPGWFKEYQAFCKLCLYNLPCVSQGT